MENPIQIIFAEDKEKFRKAILKELESFNMCCMGEAANGKELLQMLSFKNPDVVLLDLEMPVMDGNEAMVHISKEYPNTKVIVLSLHNDYILVEDYIKRGAKGYIPKDEIAGDIAMLARAIHLVMSGDIFISKKILDREAKRCGNENYTERQKEIIPLMCEGKTNKEISEEIGILERSVEKRRQKIYEKTNSSKAADFFKYAFVRGFHFLGKGS